MIDDGCLIKMHQKCIDAFDPSFGLPTTTTILRAKQIFHKTIKLDITSLNKSDQRKKQNFL